jgi:hypothetical protein
MILGLPWFPKTNQRNPLIIRIKVQIIFLPKEVSNKNQTNRKNLKSIDSAHFRGENGKVVKIPGYTVENVKLDYFKVEE